MLALYGRIRPQIKLLLTTLAKSIAIYSYWWYDICVKGICFHANKCHSRITIKLCLTAKVPNKRPLIYFPILFYTLYFLLLMGILSIWLIKNTIQYNLILMTKHFSRNTWRYNSVHKESTPKESVTQPRSRDWSSS